MQTSYFYYFLELTRTLSFAQAAANIHITQPGLTRAIQSIEHEFGYPLFIRKGNSIYITKEGEQFAKYSKSIINTLEKMKKLNDPDNIDFLFNQSDKPILHFVTTSTSFATLHALGKKAFDNWPEFRISELSLPLLLKKLDMQEESDPWLFFVSVPEYGRFKQKITKKHNLVFTPLLDIVAMAKVAQISPLAEKTVLTKKDLRNVSWAISSDPNCDDILSQVAGEDNLDDNIALRSSRRDLVTQAILEQGCVGLANNRVEPITPPEFKVIPFEEVAVSHVGFLTRKDLPLSKNLCDFKDEITAECHKLKKIPW